MQPQLQPNELPLSTWSGTDPSIVRAQSSLFSSLTSALLAAFLAFLGKQWSKFHVEGCFVDRNHHWELKMRGTITWGSSFIMECLPLTIRASLLLLGYASARYLWDLSRTISVILVYRLWRLRLYLHCHRRKTCPLQTPIPVPIRGNSGVLSGVYPRSFQVHPKLQSYMITPTNRHSSDPIRCR